MRTHPMLAVSISAYHDPGCQRGRAATIPEQTASSGRGWPVWRFFGEEFQARGLSGDLSVTSLFEVPPVSWTPEHLCSRSPSWPESTHPSRLSSGVR